MLQNTGDSRFRTPLVTDPTLPLGRKSDYPNKYQPDLLFGIARSESRTALGIGPLPFHGTDIWNAWELSWLGRGDLPVVATAEIRVPADSPRLIESKSLKLYLNSFAMSQFGHPQAVAETIQQDLEACTGGPVDVSVAPVAATEANTVLRLPGYCLDSLAVTCTAWEVDATLLRSDTAIEVQEEWHSHLLRSLCPVTAQPDIGSIAIRYSGPRIDPASLLQYIVSYREHSDFHEACIERMFVDILQCCKLEELSIHARYQRRGGIDINPFRSNFESHARNIRLWRQ
jgi:7-cyano-7-deazaguanine reductase